MLLLRCYIRQEAAMALTENQLDEMTERVLWDRGGVSGFCARKHGSGISFALMYRTRGERRLRNHTIGRRGSPWSLKAARKEAQRLLGEVIAGRDPACEKQKLIRYGETVDQVWQRYDAEVIEKTKKPSTRVCAPCCAPESIGTKSARASPAMASTSTSRHPRQTPEPLPFTPRSPEKQPTNLRLSACMRPLRSCARA
jgi:hypothetical protein